MKKYLVLGLLLCFVFAGFANPSPVKPVKKVTKSAVISKKKVKFKKLIPCDFYPQSSGFYLDDNLVTDGTYLSVGFHTFRVTWDDIDANACLFEVYQGGTSLGSSFSASGSPSSNNVCTFYYDGSTYLEFKVHLYNACYNTFEPFGFSY